MPKTVHGNTLHLEKNLLSLSWSMPPRIISILTISPANVIIIVTAVIILVKYFLTFKRTVQEIQLLVTILKIAVGLSQD